MASLLQKREEAGGVPFASFAWKAIKLLIVPQLNTVDHWESEIKKVGIRFPTFKYHGSRPHKQEVLTHFKAAAERGPCIMIAPLETIRSDLSFESPEEQYLLQFHWSVVVVDEIHRFANTESVHTQPLYKQVFVRLERKFTVGLSGTMFVSNSTDIDSALVIAKVKIPSSLKKNTKEKAAFYQKYTLCADVDDKSFPSVRYHVKRLDYSSPTIHAQSQTLQKESDHYGALHQASRKGGGHGDGGEAQVFTKFMASRTAARLYESTHCSSKQEIDEWIDKLKGNDILGWPRVLENTKFNFILQYLRDHPLVKIVVTSEFVSALRLLQLFLERHVITTQIYSASLSMTQKSHTLDYFKNGSLNVLLLSKKAGGCGLNLFGHAMFFLEPYVNSSTDDQVTCRIVRIRQTHTVDIFHLLYPCYDTKVWETKKEKHAQSTFFVEDKKNLLTNLYGCAANEVEDFRNKVVSKVDALLQKDKDLLEQKISTMPKQTLSPPPRNTKVPLQVSPLPRLLLPSSVSESTSPPLKRRKRKEVPSPISPVPSLKKSHLLTENTFLLPSPPSPPPPPQQSAVEEARKKREAEQLIKVNYLIRKRLGAVQIKKRVPKVSSYLLEPKKVFYVDLCV